jgi:hypothetical protein
VLYLDSPMLITVTVTCYMVTVWRSHSLLAVISLDNKNWAVDFGGLKELKAWLEDHFDHKLALDRADPHLAKFEELQALDLAEIRMFDGVGAEKVC